MGLATPDDVAVRLGRELTGAEHEQVVVMLGDAERILQARIPNLLSRAEADAQFRELVVMVEAMMVVRVLRNPEGYKSETDGSYGYEVSAEAASGRLMVLDAEWAWLGVRSGAYVITPYLAPPQRSQPCVWRSW